ncbi:MAG: hypothetical protein GX139_06915 [Armatimonadetes bacterium]|jgi:hypothetical protein|nr:hypothetical protein [Armatimonadota bacterium]
MKQDKKQTQQLAVLGLLVLICIGYVTFTITKPPETEMTPPVSKIDRSIAAKAVMQLQSKPLPNTADYPNLSAPIPRRDPFTVQRLASVLSEDRAAPAPSVAPSGPLSTAKSTKLAPMIPFGSFSSDAAPSVSVVLSDEPEDPEFVLTGIICGEENVAIIRNGSVKYVVKKGQFIDGGYKVLSVSSDGVVLACKDRRIHVKLGGVPNAS